MIQGQHVVQNYPTPERNKGKKITMPGLAVSISQGLQRLDKGGIVDQAAAYYEEQGMPIPQFEMMSKIEKLEALNEYRQKVKKADETLKSIAEANEKRIADEKLSKLINEKADEKFKSKTKESRSEGDG